VCCVGLTHRGSTLYMCEFCLTCLPGSRSLKRHTVSAQPNTTTSLVVQLEQSVSVFVCACVRVWTDEWNDLLGRNVWHACSLGHCRSGSSMVWPTLGSRTAKEQNNISTYDLTVKATAVKFTVSE